MEITTIPPKCLTDVSIKLTPEEAALLRRFLGNTARAEIGKILCLDPYDPTVHEINTMMYQIFDRLSDLGY